MLEKSNQKALDSVCNFHLKNGASLYQILWKADPSPLRESQSFGIMVNYLYDKESFQHNSTIYKQTGKVIASQKLQQYLNFDELDQVEWKNNSNK